MEYSRLDLPDLELLEETETKKLIKKAQQGDKNSLDKIVKHNLKLVLKVAYRFKNHDYDLQDLFQIGVIGLIKAVNNFDLQRSNKFSTYAFTRIMGEIRLYLRDDGPVKVSRNLQKIARIVRQKQREMRNENLKQPTIQEIATETGFSREEIIQAIEASKNPASIYAVTNEDEGSELYLIDNLADSQQEDQELSKTEKLNLMELIKQLAEREKKIIYLRYFEDKTQKEIGDELGISQVQVSRLEKKILLKLKNKIN